MQTLDGIALTNEEVVVRTYKCSQLAFPKCVCNLSVTNRRVILHGRTNSGRIIDYAPLDSVTAISALYGKIISIKMLIIGVVMAILGIIMVYFASMTISEYSKYSDYYSPDSYIYVILLFGFLLLTGGGLLIFFALQKKAFSLNIYTSNATNSPINIGSAGAAQAAGKLSVINLSAAPTEETDAMLCELSAMITDLQSMGDYGITLWQR